MKLLLDTHALLWALGEKERLSPAAAAAIAAPDNEVLVSAASLWEISIQQELGKLELSRTASEWLPAALEETGIDVLDITGRHALAAGALPTHHRDPFDRMLIAQSLAEGLTLVTRDERFRPYGVLLLEA